MKQNIDNKKKIKIQKKKPSIQKNPSFNINIFSNASLSPFSINLIDDLIKKKPICCCTILNCT